MNVYVDYLESAIEKGADMIAVVSGFGTGKGISMDDKDLIEQITQKTLEITKDDSKLNDSADVAQGFEGLPIESLISAPIVAAAKGQQELTSVYIDTLMSLAFSDKIDEETKEKYVSKLKSDMEDGTIQAPLLSLVPVPSFTMDGLAVDFNMEVKTSETTKNETNVNITGSVTSDSSHKRQTDSSATYNIHAHAVQQPPSEDMAKLKELFSQMMEPIPTKDEPKE